METKQPMDSTATRLFQVWVYAPNDDGTGWLSPAVHEDEAPTLEDAHDFARRMRQIFHGHLFAVTAGGRRPLEAHLI
jgi:hypothetical protein